MSSDTIRKQIRQGEGIGIEFISSTTKQEAIARTVCAFLNTKGGTLFCGVEENGKIIGIIDGTSEAENLQLFLHNAISPKALLSIGLDEENDKTIVTIEVPRGKDRPYVYEGAVYVRHGSQTRTADSATLRDMVRSKSIEPERWERRPSTALEEEDLDPGEIFTTAREGEESKRFTFSDSTEIISILENLGLCRAGRFSQAADVLFAKSPALRHPQVRVRAIRYAEDKASDHYLDDQVLQGPLVTTLNKVMAFVKRNVALTTRFDSDQIRRRDIPEYPDYALREALVNAFAHRDYAGFSGGISVGIYPSRIEIWNSGHLPEGLKPNDLKRNHPSIPTNPDIAHVLYIRGLMERIGRGTQKILNSCRDYGAPSPKWIDKPSGVTLTLYSARLSTGDGISLNIRQQALLDALAPGDEIKPSEYQKRFAGNVSNRQARRDLAGLEDRSYLIRIGGGAGSRYKRTNRT